MKNFENTFNRMGTIEMLFAGFFMAVVLLLIAVSLNMAYRAAVLWYTRRLLAKRKPTNRFKADIEKQNLKDALSSISLVAIIIVVISYFTHGR